MHSRRSPNKGRQNQKSKPPLGVTMMPLGAPSISKYVSLVRRDAQMFALRAHCARTALEAPPKLLEPGCPWVVGIVIEHSCKCVYVASTQGFGCKRLDGNGGLWFV